MHAGFSFSYSPISVLLRQPLSIKKSYAGAVHTVLSSHLNAFEGKKIIIQQIISCVTVISTITFNRTQKSESFFKI
jgi:hypothetical protein